jgi:phage-related protein
VVQKLPQAMEPIIKAVLDKMRDLREGMIQALANLRDRFVDFGKNLVQGLIDGIQSMISKLGETISGIAGEVANRFKRVLGIQSPSRVFFEFGKNISEGLNNGIQSIPTVPVGIEGIVNAGGINQNLMGMASPSASQAGFNPQLLNSFLEQQSAMFEKFNRSVRIFDEVANKQTVASMRY